MSEFLKNKPPKSLNSFWLLYSLVFIILLSNGFLFYKISQNNQALEDLIASSGQEEREGNNINAENLETIQDLINEVNDWKTYSNEKYNWKINYPENWFVLNENSNNEIEKVVVSGKEFRTGGETYWSNYQDINQFEKTDTPADFKLLALVIYQDENKSMQEFSRHLGFIPSLEPSVVNINAKNLSGNLYILDKIKNGESNNINNIKTAAIFKQDDLFYVFHIGLTEVEDKNEATIQEIKKIISTFEIRQ